MSLTKKINRFLQVDNLVCAYDGKDLGKQLSFFKKGASYYKMKLFPQSPWFSWRWLKQVYTGDDYVLRFCDLDCYRKFITEGRVDLNRERALL